MSINEEIRKRLFENQDLGYRDFHAKLMPTVSKDLIIGVRVPIIRNLGKEYAGRDDIEEFLLSLPHRYYEENNLHGDIISRGKDFDTVIYRLNDFLPYVDNWATCDLMVPKVFKKHTGELMPHILCWINSGKTYTVRFAVGMLMSFYLKEHFDTNQLLIAASIKSDEYYVNMMVGWYFATALAFHYDETFKFIKSGNLSQQVRRLTIKKVIESNRISQVRKEELRKLR